MTTWTDGYVTDVPYTYGFYRELTPALLSFAALVHARQAPEGPITYCELGCGQGLSANIIAGANPDVRVYATDFNPGQVAEAKSLSREAGLDNIAFYEDSFADFGACPELPGGFDIIALHGIYSWISAGNRGHIVDFIRRRLKPGGLVYLSYNTLPGWSASMPLRHLMTAFSSGATSQRIEHAFQQIETLKAANAQYFAANPVVGTRFDRFKTMPGNYLAHEYFNADWHPFYFSQVATELDAAKLSFIGSVHIADTVESLNITDEQAQVLRQCADLRLRESLRDYMVNQQFRRDLFGKGTPTISALEARERWLALRIALSTPRDMVPMTVAGARGESNLQPQFYEPILDSLADGPITLRDLISKVKILSASPWASIIQMITVLIATNHVQPCRPASQDDLAREKCTALNAAILRRSIATGQLAYWASPVTGGAVQIDRFQQMFARAVQVGERDPVASAWISLQTLGQRLMDNGVALNSEAENLSRLKQMYDDFNRRVGNFRQLGLI